MNAAKIERSDRIHKAIGEGLIRRAEAEGRELDNFVAEWIRHCEALNQNPMDSAEIILVLADVDRYIAQEQGKNKHGPKELQIEQQAYVRHRRKTEGLNAV